MREGKALCLAVYPSHEFASVSAFPDEDQGAVSVQSKLRTWEKWCA
jgi:hypothetical protein